MRLRARSRPSWCCRESCLLGCKSFSFRGGHGGGVGLLLLDGLAFPTSRHNKDYIWRGPRFRTHGTDGGGA